MQREFCKIITSSLTDVTFRVQQNRVKIMFESTNLKSIKKIEVIAHILNLAKTEIVTKTDYFFIVIFFKEYNFSDYVINRAPKNHGICKEERKN